MQAESFGAQVSFEWLTGYPATINDEAAVEQVKATISRSFGAEAYSEMEKPLMGSEDFSFMLEKVPGAYVLIGNGDSSGLHTSTYNFNDAILENGVRLFCQLAKDCLQK